MGFTWIGICDGCQDDARQQSYKKEARRHDDEPVQLRLRSRLTVKCRQLFGMMLFQLIYIHS